MGLKAIITQQIDDDIRNKTPKVVKVEHADVEQAILDNGYDSGLDTQITQTYTTKSGTVITYTLLITKSHGIVHLNIKFKNTSASNVSNGTPVFTWKLLFAGQNNPFIPKAGFAPIANAFDSANTLYVTKVKVDDTGMSLPKGATAGMEYDAVNISYPSKY